MAFTYAVITGVADPATGGNMATDTSLFDLWYVSEQASDDNNWTETLAKANPEGVTIVDDHGTPVSWLHLRRPVFHVGELLILNESGREVTYPGRKPSKWFVDVAEYDDLDAALARANEIRDAEMERMLQSMTKGDDQ